MKNLKRFLIVATMVLMFILGGCVTSVSNAEQTHPLRIWKQNDNGMCSTWNVVDEETGVNYIVVTTWYSSGNASGRSCTITPRLNADGSLYCE